MTRVRFLEREKHYQRHELYLLSTTDTKKRFWECEKADDNSVAGRIKHFASFWEQKLKASKFIMDIIRNGYILSFENIPPPFYAQNNKSNFRETKFVEESILKLLTDGCIRSVKGTTSLHKPTNRRRKKFKAKASPRPQTHQQTYHSKKFKYESLKNVSELYEKDVYLMTFDPQSGYHHVPY